ncbi:MAG: tyrosine-type recombinase/integrase [Bacteroidales bacterium]|nr:tyrosine-type recombinase/integrase [Candidatus Colimorpha merdihippi]
MKQNLINKVLDRLSYFPQAERDALREVLLRELEQVEITPRESDGVRCMRENNDLEQAFIAAKRLEGCSEKSLTYYHSTLHKLLTAIDKPMDAITTADIRSYLASIQETRSLSRVTIDNIRRIFSSFFSWLEDEDLIRKSPVRRIRKVRAESLIKEVLTDENLEVLRDSCIEPRDLGMIDLLVSTGIRVGELVKMNRQDIDFQERQCVVFGKGNKEREVYFNARAKIHLLNYLRARSDDNPALFVSLHAPHSRLTIGGVESRLRAVGSRANIHHIHPHKFRRTMATMAIDKGMPIEQVQKLLGHVRVDTTLHYAQVNQNNVKLAHRKYIS